MVLKKLFENFGGAKANIATRIRGTHNTVFNTVVQGGVVVPLPLRKTQWIPQLQGGAGVAALLGWQSRWVPLLGREAALAELVAWRDEAFPLSIKLLSAPGGAGKTRLAAEFSEHQAQGWQHGWVGLREFERAESLAWQGQWLLIVDYPEHDLMGLERLARVLSRWKPLAQQRLRVLLLVREADSVERVLTEQRCAAFMAPRLALPDLPEPEGWRLFEQAMAHLKNTTQVAAPPVTAQAFADWQATNALHRSPLFVLAQAIFWMAEAHTGRASDHRWLQGGALLAALVGMERAVWQRAERGHQAPADSVQATLAWATLCGGLTAAQINEHLATAWCWSHADVRALHNSLNSMGRQTAAQACTPMAPDLLAAQFVTQAWQQPAWQGGPQTQRDARLAAALLPVNDAPAFAQQLNRLHMLAYDQTVRLAACSPDAGHSVERLLQCWAGLEPTLEEALESGLNARAQWVAFARMAVFLGRKALTDRGCTMSDEQRARALNNLANSMSETGDRQGALVPSTESVHIYQKLAKANPAAFEPFWAQSLNNLANQLNETGNYRDALAPAMHAVRIYERLVQTNPAVYEPRLAPGLINLANSLSGTGDHQGSLARTQEAVNIYRRLVQTNLGFFEPNFAKGLSNLAVSLFEIGDRQGALTPAMNAVDIYKQLAHTNAAAYEPDLAISLNNFANLLSATGELQAALVPAQDTVIIYRRLAHSNPAAYDPDLAMSLTNLANRLSETGDRAGAAASAMDAVNIYRRLAQANQAAYEPNLAMSLWTAMRCFASANQRQPALIHGHEALRLFTQLAEREPARFQPYLQALQAELQQLEQS